MVTLRRKWSLASKVFLLLGVLFGACAYLLFQGYVERLRALIPEDGGPVAVVVARADGTRGAVLTADALELETLPSAYVPPGALTDLSTAVGRTLLADVAQGEVLTRTRVGGRGVGPVAALVPDGFRAFAVGTSLPPGSVRAGDRVDVLATFAGGRPHTDTVATAVEVLLVLGGSSGPGGSQSLLDAGVDPTTSAETLMLLVYPDQAERLAYARAFADLTVSISGLDA